MILIAYGTRPEWIKVKRLIEIFKKNNTPIRVLFTGQQKDIGEFEYDLKINIPKNETNRLNTIVSSIITSDVFDNIEHVIVQGDTASSFAVALAAFNKNIPISHIEAGLRTFDSENPYPEECYRQMISCIANYHFCPTANDLSNLIREGKAKQAWVVGNTVIDTLPPLNVTYDDVVLITMHRRENLDKIEKWFFEFEKLSCMFPNIDFVIPLHPNPVVQNKSRVLKNVRVIEPLAHEQLLKLIASSKMIITDSGGIQEEAAFYNKLVLVCRTVTERPASNQIMIKEPSDLIPSFEKHIQNYQLNIECPFGDGLASERIYSLIMEIKNVV